MNTISRKVIRSCGLTFALAIVGATLGGCNKASTDAILPLSTRPSLPKAQAADAANSCVGSKLDEPATPQNSFVQEFAPGVLLHVPRCVGFGLDFAKLNAPLKAQSVALTLLFPDMTLTDWALPSFIKTDPGHEALAGRFWVKILWMSYVPPDSDSFVLGSKQPAFQFDPRPPRIELNRYCLTLVNGRCDGAMQHIASEFPGIDVLFRQSAIEASPSAAVVPSAERGGTYVAKPGAPYELFMDCDAFGSMRCQAFVYSKKHHLQYRMLFPPDAVARTDEIVNKIDKMLDQWAAK